MLVLALNKILHILFDYSSGANYQVLHCKSSASRKHRNVHIFYVLTKHGGAMIAIEGYRT